MSWKRIREVFVAGALILLVALMGVGPYVVRDLVAAFLIFWSLLGALGIAVLVSFLLGEGVVRCFALLVAGAASFRLRQPASSAVVPLAHGIGTS